MGSMVTLALIASILWALFRNIAGADVVLMGGALAAVTLSLVSDRFTWRFGGGIRR